MLWAIFFNCHRWEYQTNAGKFRNYWLRNMLNIFSLVFRFIFQNMLPQHSSVFGSNIHMPLRLWDEFEYIELQKNQRQKDDLAWANTLNRIRIGAETTQDIELLESRRIKPANEVEKKMNDIHLAATRYLFIYVMIHEHQLNKLFCTFNVNSMNMFQVFTEYIGR